MNLAIKGSLLLVLLVVPALGQMHNIGASATSVATFGNFGGNFGGGFGNFGGFANNIPASVTSFRPPGFGRPIVPVGPGFTSGRFIPGRGFRFVDGFNHRNFGFFPAGFTTPVYVVPDQSQIDAAQEQLLSDLPVGQAGPAGPSEPQKVEITIVDSRQGRDQGEPRDAAPAKAEPKAAPSPEPELTPTIIVLHDGTRKELRSYAIMGKDLFDISDNKMFRIPLDSVDVDATVAANAANGKQFRLP